MDKVASITSWWSSKTQSIASNIFAWLGKKIYRRPWLFILIGLFLTIICSGGFYFFSEENRGLYLWIPRDSNPWAEYNYVISTFGSYPAAMSLLITVVDLDDNILSPSNLDTTYSIYNIPHNNITLSYNPNNNDGDKTNNIKYNYDYPDLCLRLYPSSPFCSSDFTNIFGFLFGFNSILWSNFSDIEFLINSDNSKIEAFAGGLRYDSDPLNSNNSNYIIGGDTLRIYYLLEGSTNETEQDIVYEYMGKFQEYWSEHLNDYNEFNINYFTERTFDDEISRILSDDIPIFGAALICMLVYLMFTLGKISCIGARPWLAFSALLVMLCAMAMGFGIAMYFGTEFNTICALVPYILLGVGVDDMIILVDTYDKTPMPDDDLLKAADRLSNALVTSGLSISLTSFCSSVAFALGSLTDIPGISSFCVFAAWAFISNYILQFLLFVPLMVYDDRRIRRKQNFCCPCCYTHGKKAHNDQITFWDPEKVVKNNGAISSKMKDDIVENNNKESSSSVSKCKCSMEYLVSITFIPMLSNKICRYIIIFIFLVLFGLSIYVAPELNTESDISKLVPDDSYLLDYFRTIQDKFDKQVLDEIQIIIQNQDISQKAVRDNIFDLIDALQQEDDAIGKVDEWLSVFSQWVLMNKNGQSVDDIDSHLFYSYLQQFANDSVNARWHSEINYDNRNNPSQIDSTRFTLNVFKADTVTGQYPQYIQWNEIFNDYLDSNGFIFTPDYCFAYLSVNITHLTIENMILAAIGVFVILLLMLDTRMAIFILIIVAMIDVDLFGWMYIFNVSLDSVSYSQCVMAVGLTVDYVIHLSHAISDASPPAKDVIRSDVTDNQLFIHRLKIAMTDMGTSVCKGAFTTFLGAVALIFSQSEAFRIFFYMFTGIIVIAIAHGMLLTPAILGEFKWIYYGIHENKNKYHRNHNNGIKKAMDELTLAKSMNDSNIDDDRNTNNKDNDDNNKDDGDDRHTKNTSLPSTNIDVAATRSSIAMPNITNTPKRLSKIHLSMNPADSTGGDIDDDNDKKRSSVQMAAFMGKDDSDDSDSEFIQ